MIQTSLKTGLAALAAVLVLPMAAAAQTPASPAAGAAATLPNTFDRPAQTAPTPAPAAAPAASVPSDPATVAAAETALKKTIAAFQSGAPNYGDMTADLAAKVREQAPTVTPLVKGFGEVLGVTHVGNRNGAELFLVMFANAPTQWILGQDAEGKIAALLFRPAPAAPETTAPATTAPATTPAT